MKVLCSFAVAVGLLLATGCGGAGEADTAGGKAQPVEKKAKTGTEEKGKSGKGLRLLEITIDGYPNADYAGLYLGDRLGYFADVGLKLHVHTPIEPKRPVLYVAAEVVELGVSHQPEVALAQARGAPIVAVGSWLTHSTTSLIWLDRDHIKGIADLKGKTIATEGLEYQERLLETILARANLSLDDVKVVRPRYLMIPALKNGKVDAAIGGSWNVEGLQLRGEGLDPVVVPVTKLGVPDYEELVLIARKDQLPQNEGMVRDFISGLTRGTRAAASHPAAAVRAIRDAYPEHDLKWTAKGVALTLPILSRTQRMDRARWRSFTAWMEDSGLIEEPLPVSGLLTNAYAP